MINGTMLRDALISGAANIANHKKRVDELNVFPVPDGDTGTNMSMTIGNAARELRKAGDGESIAKIAEIAAGALLRGARGNSGVILSLLFRGISKGLAGYKEADGAVLAAALKSGVDAAYKAVMKPTEGTVLTVARFAADRAARAAEGNMPAVDVFAEALEGAKEALAQTPELLPVLKKAGVVDAGGQGLVIIFEGMLRTFRTGEIVRPAEESAAEAPVSRNAAGEFEGEITFTYCTEFIVNRDKSVTRDPLAARAFLETIGDSLVFVEDDDMIKVHVHTDDPGRALQEGQKYGPLTAIKIENMRDQHERAKHEARESKAAGDDSAPPAEPDKDYGFVAVAAGEGLQNLFRDLGADRIVSGGQTMNPSTEDLLRAIEATPARTVFVLPNNKNIIMAAEQAVPLATRNVIVIHTRTVPMGISALLAFDPEADAETNAIAMRDAADRVSTGQITFAARDSDFDGHRIKAGEIMALTGGKIAFIDQDPIRAVARLAKSMVKKDTSFLTVIYGEDVTEDQAEAAKAAVEAQVGDRAEITFINGGQPVYYFILSAE